MKSAACWFSSKWTVRTKALGDDMARLVKFDVSRIVTDQIEELEIEEATEDKNAHYTEVVLDDRRALIEAGQNRLRPIAMTTLAAILTLLPLAFAIGQGSAIQQPLAIAIISGLVVQLPLVLLVMPSVYLVFEKGYRLWR